MPKWNFLTLLLGQKIPLNTSVFFFIKCPLSSQELIAQNPYRSRVKAIFWGPKGYDFSIHGMTELLEPFLAKKNHRGTP